VNFAFSIPFADQLVQPLVLLLRRGHLGDLLRTAPAGNDNQRKHQAQDHELSHDNLLLTALSFDEPEALAGGTAAVTGTYFTQPFIVYTNLTSRRNSFHKIPHEFPRGSDAGRTKPA
jgi:hypothetical protein